MNLAALPDWVAIAIALGGLAVAIRVRMDSAADAHRSAASAAKAQEAAERSAAAQEEMVALARVKAEEYKPPWRIVPRRQREYVLLNEGVASEYGVALAGEHIARLDFNGPSTIGPGSGASFFAMESGNEGPPVITVTWHRRPDLGDTPWTWQHPLPAPAGR